MRLLTLCAVSAFSVVAVMLVTASPSLAAPAWSTCIETPGAGDHEDPACMTNMSGDFLEVPFTIALTAKSKGTLTLSDEKIPIVGKASVKCETLDEGTVGPGAADEITKITSTGGSVKIKCTAVTGCEAGTDIEAEATGLPWKTELYEEGGKIRDHLGKVGETAPGWKVSCLVLGISVSDTCSGITSVGVKNVIASGRLTGKTEGVFDASSPAASCTEGGVGSGKVEGTDTFEFAEGGAVR